MKLLWFTWKDLSHPQAGGAEVVNQELARRLVADGHEVTFIVGGYPNAKTDEIMADGYRVVRLGNRWTVYWKAYRYYRKHLIGWADLVIDEVNTFPFFAKYYTREHDIALIHQLCRQIWFYQMPIPVSIIGYMLEPLYLKLINNSEVITISESSKADLINHGFHTDRIHIISMGTTGERLPKLPPLSSKTPQPTLLSLGSIRPMKRTLDQVRAFEIAKQSIPSLKLAIAGDSSGKYGEKVLAAIKASPYSEDITYFGRVSEHEKNELVRNSHLVLQTSIKEGWGLTVTEAANLGTPAVTYNIDGLRDSVRNGVTGVTTERNNPEILAAAIVRVLGNKAGYSKIRAAAWKWNGSINFDTSYHQFKEILGI